METTREAVLLDLRAGDEVLEKASGKVLIGIDATTRLLSVLLELGTTSGPLSVGTMKLSSLR